MSQIQKIQASLSSLLQAAYTAAIPTDPTNFETDYKDYVTGETKTITIPLRQIKEFHTEPVPLSSEYPFIVTGGQRTDFPDLGTQQAQDEIQRIAIDIWNIDLDLLVLDRSLQCYAEIARKALSENEETFRRDNLITRLTISENSFNASYRTENSWIRSVRINLNIKMVE